MNMSFTETIELPSFFADIPKFCFFMALLLSIYFQYKTKWNVFALLYFTILGFALFYSSMVVYQFGYNIFMEGFIYKSRVFDTKFFILFFGIFCFIYILTVTCLFYISFTLVYSKAFNLISKIAKSSFTYFVLPLLLIGFDSMLISILFGFFLDAKTFNFVEFIIVAFFVLVLSIGIIGYFKQYVGFFRDLKKKKIYKKRN